MIYFLFFKDKIEETAGEFNFQFPLYGAERKLSGLIFVCESMKNTLQQIKAMIHYRISDQL